MTDKSKKFSSQVAKSLTIGLIPALTHNISVAAQAVRDGGETMLESGAGVITQAGQINQNPNSFGFALEHLQAIGFNFNASLHGADARAYQIPVDGLKHGPDIYIDKNGQLLAQFQVKGGTSDYVERVVASGNYADPIITNAENSGIAGSSSIIQADGVTSIPIPLSVAKFAAEYPYSFSWLLEASANVGEVTGAGINGAVINASINALHTSIHQLGAYCRGETELDWEFLQPLLSQVLQGMQSGFIRGAVVKILQRLLGGNGAAILGAAISTETIPALIQLIKGETTLERVCCTVGPRLLTNGLLTAMILLFPPIGLALTTSSLIHAIWAEIKPEWKAVFQAILERTTKAIEKGIEAAKTELTANPWNWLSSSSASVSASVAELIVQEELLDEFLKA